MELRRRRPLRPSDSPRLLPPVVLELWSRDRDTFRGGRINTGQRSRETGKVEEEALVPPLTLTQVFQQQNSSCSEPR